MNTLETSRFHEESELLPCRRAFLASSVQPFEKDFCALSHEVTYTFQIEGNHEVRNMPLQLMAEQRPELLR